MPALPACHLPFILDILIRCNRLRSINGPRMYVIAPVQCMPERVTPRCRARPPASRTASRTSTLDNLMRLRVCVQLWPLVTCLNPQRQVGPYSLVFVDESLFVSI